MRTQLDGYNLWYDGTLEVEPNKLEEFMMQGIAPSSLCVTELNKDIKNYNRVSKDKILLKDSCNPINPRWLMPDDFINLDIEKYVETELLTIVDQDYLYEERLRRVVDEIQEYEERGLYPLLRVIIYVLHTFKEKKIVWGVGRGSSCASYILYLMGLHCVDSVKYDIPLDEFFR